MSPSRKPSALIGLTLALGLLLAAASAAAPAQTAVVVDGLVSDWGELPPIYEAPPPTSTTNGPRISRVWVRSDRHRLVLRVQLTSEVLLQANSGLVLHLDTDRDADTGRRLDELGVDLSWSFSDRQGRAHVLGVPVRILQAAIQLRQAPVVSASEFEIALTREASIAGAMLPVTATCAMMLRVETEGRVESSTGRLDLTLEDHVPEPSLPTSIPFRADGHLRVLSYNVLFDGVFERPLPFRRILGALEPDIVSLQELYRHSADETLEWIRRVLPGGAWHAAGAADGVILSRFPVLEEGPIGTGRRGLWAILDTPDGRLAVINPHPPCCNDDAGRQEEFDAIAAWIRDARVSGRLGPETPVVVAGDMNLVGDAAQLRTLLDGTIADTARHGPAAAPDGDGTGLADAMPSHLSGTEVYTWRNDDGEFSPGKLDYIVYTDSVLGLGRSFVLWTPDLPESTLREAGLEADDTALASDHLPVIADFYFRAASSR